MESCIVEHMFDVAELAAVDPHADQAALIEQIAWLERVKSAASAGQARAAAALDANRRAAEAAAGVPTAKQGRGVAGEVALARRDSPARGGRHLGLAKALVHEMPHTLAALEPSSSSATAPATPRRSARTHGGRRKAAAAAAWWLRRRHKRRCAP